MRTILSLKSLKRVLTVLFSATAASQANLSPWYGTNAVQGFTPGGNCSMASGQTGILTVQNMCCPVYDTLSNRVQNYVSGSLQANPDLFFIYKPVNDSGYYSGYDVLLSDIVASGQDVLCHFSGYNGNFGGTRPNFPCLANGMAYSEYGGLGCFGRQQRGMLLHRYQPVLGDANQCVTLKDISVDPCVNTTVNMSRYQGQPSLMMSGIPPAYTGWMTNLNHNMCGPVSDPERTLSISGYYQTFFNAGLRCMAYRNNQWASGIVSSSNGLCSLINASQCAITFDLPDAGDPDLAAFSKNETFALMVAASLVIACTVSAVAICITCCAKKCCCKNAESQSGSRSNIQNTGDNCYLPLVRSETAVV